ncbi:hypothetical protein SASPL_131783 [Salvia splendens]|uniref:F-box domain-containing protein n=1 Tax=Salvia splendens TaxID=180675 RepID=A0A8X8ZKX6_SALSN|nr:putative F-box protein At1g67623 [Salvia splendens]KAG6408762.1 hypothetical protein SASPL_131783 [Salvia splendens]
MRMRRRFPKKNKVSYLQTIPRELTTHILSRVAASSAADLSSIKQSCQELREIAEDSYVYQHASLDKFPIVEWSPICEKKQKFLNKCKESSNPEIWYREALLDFFNKKDYALALRKFSKAAEAGHVQALYLCCIMMLLSGNQRRGVGMIAKIKKDGIRVGLCCRKLIEELRQIWVLNPLLSQSRLLCSKHHNRYRPRTNNWSGEEYEDEDEDDCTTCVAARHIKLICACSHL